MPKSIYRPEYTTLRELIRELRLARGLTQEAVSRRLGHGQSFLSDIELRDLCALLDMTLPDFIEALEGRLSSKHSSR